MPRKYNVTVEFDLSTEVEADLDSDQFYPDDSRVKEYEESSYFSTGSVEVSGGSIAFTVEAEDEEEAESVAYTVVYDDMEVEDRNGLTWMLAGVSVEVEEVIVPMTTERAVELVTAFIDSMDGMDDDLREAFSFLLQVVSTQGTRIAALSGELDRLRNGPDGSEAAVTA
jgi:hypothetical protein